MRSKFVRSSWFATIGLFMLAALPQAHASLIFLGVTYTLTEYTTSNPLTDQFTLSITGINGGSDTEGNRYGVNAFAFTPPSNFASTVAPSGFTNQPGGLNSSGCDGKGGFFCFAANATPTGPALPAGSSLNFTFSITLSSGNFSGYVPDFKIDWAGSKHNYDLVSQNITPTPGGSITGGGTTGGGSGSAAPEPGTLALIGTALVGLPLIRGSRRRRGRNKAL